MDKNQKKVLTIIFIIILIISILAIILELIIKKEDKKTNNYTPPLKENYIAKNIEILNDSDKFFEIQKILNDYYTHIANKNTAELLKILDSKWLGENNINSGNLFKFINSNYEIVSYTPKTIYYNPNSSVTYYFVNGYLYDTDLLNSKHDYYEDIKYLIIVDASSHYVIRPINSTKDIETYAKGYNIENYQIDNNYIFNAAKISDENKLVIYLNEFFSLLITKPEKAYLLLDEQTQNRYDGVDDFKNQIVDIYAKYTSKIFGFTSKDEENQTIYYIKDNNQNDIEIYETSVMNFKIHY